MKGARGASFEVGVKRKQRQSQQDNATFVQHNERVFPRDRSFLQPLTSFATFSFCSGGPAREVSIVLFTGSYSWVLYSSTTPGR